MRLIGRTFGTSLGPGRRVFMVFVLLMGLGLACGHIRPAPEGLNPQDYTPITYEQLLAPRTAGLAKGQKVRVEGYFWQFVEYDPAMLRNYLTLSRQPLAWSRLRWASLYEVPQMRGYYDRLALTREQQRDWKLKRLEHVRIYGQLAPLGLGTLYLQAHHLDRVDPEAGPREQVSTTPESNQEEYSSP